jgi:ElaB/YqjD/DUF883 family membrane-anchored ribosome-binding protein
MADAQQLADKIRTGDTEGVRNTVSDVADQARQRADDFSRQAKDRLDSTRRSAADTMDSAADRLGQSNVGSSSKVADGLHSAADYVRSNDFGAMMSDLGRAIKSNPVPSLIAAVAVGFLIGAALNRD